MKNKFSSLCALGCNALLSANVSGADIRDEVSIQVYHLIRDRDKDKKNNQPADAENEEKENDEK